MSFKHLSLSGWQHFDRIEIDFHERLTVLTGANGSGKTTLLRFLARHFGWDYYQLRTPTQTEKRGILYRVRLLFGRADEAQGSVEVGSLIYASGQKSLIRIPTGENAITYRLNIDNPEQVPGLFIPSHRPEFRYQRVENLPLRQRAWAQDAFSTVQNAIRSLSLGSGGYSASYHMKEILIGFALFGYGNEIVEADPAAKDLFESFQRVLSWVLPPQIGFVKLAVRDRAEVVLVTRTGDFVLDAVSGGVAALIELAWQIFMLRPIDSKRFAVVIDEPENHLHASMQRSLLPSFIRAFPAAQFIVATHSPLIVGSERDSNVYVLRFTESNMVSSEVLDLRDKASTAEEILREVLDVEVTMPVWAEEALKRIVDSYRARDMTPETARALREEMRLAGLERWIPDALIKIAG